MRARLGAAPPCARRATRTAAPAAPAVYCSAARASRLRLRVAPGSGQPAAPSALRGGRTLRLRRLSLAALRIHSLRSGRGLTGVNLCAGRVGPSLRRALRYGRRAAAFPCSSTGGGGVWRPLATLTAGAGGRLGAQEGDGRARVADTRPTPLTAPRGSSPPTRHRRHRPLPTRGRARRGRRRCVARTGRPCRRRARVGQPHGRAPLRSRLRRRLGPARCAVCPRQGAQPLPSALARPAAADAGAHAIVTSALRRAP